MVAIKAKVLAEKSFRSLLDCRFSQPRINSSERSHMKKSWKVLPFHINSNDAGSNVYSHRNGIVKATIGRSFNMEFECFLMTCKMFRIGVTAFWWYQ